MFFGLLTSASGSVIHQYGSRLWIRILPSISKKNEENLDFYCFVTFSDFLSLKNDINVPSKKSKKRPEMKFSDEKGRIRIQIRSWIRIRIRTSQSQVRIRGSASGSIPECQGSRTLLLGILYTSSLASAQIFWNISLRAASPSAFSSASCKNKGKKKIQFRNIL